MSNRLARFLIERGIGPEMPVAVALPRSVDYVKSVWAVAKAGGAFLPVDPAYPADRINHILTDSHARWGLTVRELRSQLPESVDWIVIDDDIVASAVADRLAHRVSDADRTGIVRPDNIAYTIYTSGSTGLPKGVLVSNVGLANIAADMRDLYQVRAGSRSLAVASPSFDASVFEQLLCPVVGRHARVGARRCFRRRGVVELHSRAIDHAHGDHSGGARITRARWARRVWSV